MKKFPFLKKSVLAALALFAAGTSAFGGFYEDSNAAFLPEELKISAGTPVLLDRHPRNKLLTLEVEINGVPAKMLLDTGATHTTLDKNFVEKFLTKSKRVPVKIKQSTNVKTRDFTIECVKINSLKIGGNEQKEFLAATLNLADVAENFPGGPVFAGVLGMNTLGAAPFRLSVKNKTFVWLAGTPRSLPAPGTRIDPGNANLSVEGILPDGGKINFRIDSGSTISVVPAKSWTPGTNEAEKIILESVDVNEKRREGVHFGVPAVVNFAGVPVKIAPRLLDAPDFPELLGNDALCHFDLVVDRKSGLIWIEETAEE